MVPENMCDLEMIVCVNSLLAVARERFVAIADVSLVLHNTFRHYVT